jgi:hypothetical protein
VLELSEDADDVIRVARLVARHERL